MIETRAQELSGKKRAQLKNIVFDTTRPGIKPRIGHLHPMSQVLFDVVEVFKSLGYQAADGPEIETDHYNFEVLNIPRDHPSRSERRPYGPRNERLANATKSLLDRNGDLLKI